MTLYSLCSKRTAANVVFDADGWWSTMPSLPDASWLSVTGDIWIAETRRFEASRVIFQGTRFFRSKNIDGFGTSLPRNRHRWYPEVKKQRGDRGHAASDASHQASLPVKPVLTQASLLGESSLYSSSVIRL